MIPVSAVSPVAASRPVERLGDAARPPTPMIQALLQTASTETLLSRTAALLEALQTSPGLANPQASPPLIAAPPALGSAAVVNLAGALQKVLAESGLFYESHLAEWVQGDRDLATLLSEPQAQLPALPAANPSSTLHGHPSGDLPDTPVTVAGRLARDSAAEQAGRHPAGESLPIVSLAQIVDPRALTLVQQQLQAIDTQVLPWQGEVWPGQTAHWTVATPVDPEGHTAVPDEARSWTSHLKLSLPHLGEIHAELILTGARCQVRLRTDPRQLSSLRGALPELARALGDAGLRAERIMVERHDTL